MVLFIIFLLGFIFPPLWFICLIAPFKENQKNKALRDEELIKAIKELKR